MIPITVTGWSALRSDRVDVAGMYEEPLPATTAHALTGFDPRARLGRKGTGSYDRVTGLAVVCCKQALDAAGTTVDEDTRTRIGVALGTSLGSFKSTSDYSRETLVQERPYLVNPLLFPNTVMNCAAGQVAIRFGLKAVNATIAGGPVAFLNAIRYAGNAIERGYAEAMLTGAAEEFTPHRAWASHLTGATREVAVGEGAGVFVLAGQDAPEWVGRARTAQILAVATAYGPDGTAERSLAGCVHRVLARSGVAADSVTTVLTGEPAEDEFGEYGPAVAALGRRPERVMTKELVGDCDAASAALGLAALLESGGTGVALLTARGADGAVGAALVAHGSFQRGSSRRGSFRKGGGDVGAGGR